MRRMEALRPRERGRPRKCPRRELPEAEATNEINADEETANITAADNGNDNNSIAPAQASEDSSSLAVGTVAVEAAVITSAPADVSARVVVLDPVPINAVAPDGTYGLPSASSVKPRRRPRKGIPRRLPFN